MASEPVVRHIQIIWTDLSNITRGPMVTKTRFENSVKNSGLSFPYCVLAFAYMDNRTFERPSGEVTLMPDLDRPLWPLPWLPGAALVFSSFYYQNAPWALCPRSFLRKQEKKLAEKNMKISVGFELEFYLVDPRDKTPIDNTVHVQTKSYQGKAWPVLMDIVETLENFGIQVWRYHAEAGPGQFEISIGPFEGSVLDAGDSLVLARETIYHLSARHGLQATFLPKPFRNELGSGAHTHVSLSNLAGRNLFEIEQTEQGTHFVGGILSHFSDLMLIFNPTGNAYERLQPGHWAGVYKTIGTENKEACIRLIRKGLVIERFEIKPIDGTSNPYLLLGSIIGAGLDGIERSCSIPAEVLVDPSTLPHMEQPERLPASLEESVSAFRSSAFSQEVFGDELFNLILKIRQAELDHWYSASSEEDKRNLLLERY